MIYLLFGTSLTLSACAAYYSVMGLLAIFSAMPVPIFIMGSLLEASKLVVASWLYRSWKTIPLLMKSYFVAALIILMTLTSLGTYGYLSKAHSDQAIPQGDSAAKLLIVEEKIKTQKDIIVSAKKELTQMDAQVDAALSRSVDVKGTSTSVNIRKNQQTDRSRISKEIATAQLEVAKLNDERAPLAAESRKIEAEVGPIKYIAALIYGGEVGTDSLERAVRAVIIMIVVVFDPLAVLLLIAANWSMRKKEEPKEESVATPEPTKTPEPQDIEIAEESSSAREWIAPNTDTLSDRTKAFLAKTQDVFR